MDYNLMDLIQTFTYFTLRKLKWWMKIDCNYFECVNGMNTEVHVAGESFPSHCAHSLYSIQIGLTSCYPVLTD